MKKPCPRCRENGNDRSGDNMEVYPDGHGHCFRCDYHVKNYDDPYESESVVDDMFSGGRMKIQDACSLPVRRLTHKPISKEVCEKFGVRVEIGEETGAIEKIYYPYVDSKGNVVAYKVKSPNKPKKERYHWLGEPGKATMFGINAVRRKGNLLIVTEGEDDCLAVSEMLKIMGKNYNVVSIPNGANESGKLDKQVTKSVNFFTNYKQIALCFDMDEPGKETASAMAYWLAPFCKVRVVNLPRKDSGDMLINNEHNIWWSCLGDADEYKPDDVIAFSDLSLEDLKRPLPEGYKLPYPVLQDKLQGLRKGEVTLVCAGSGVGKTTWLREIAHSLASDHDMKIAHIFLEEGVEKTALSYIAIDNNVPLPKLRIDPNIITKEQWENSYEKYSGEGKLFFTDHFGSLESSELVSKMRYFVHHCEVDFIILDHISMVISGQESSNERKDIDMLMTNMAAFVNETGVGILAVVHLRRAQSGSFTEGKEITLSDLRGSGGLEQLSWNVIAIERNQQDPDNKNESQLRLLKNREWGSLGLCDTMIYNQDTGRMLPHTTEEF
jgi:twinkle protein